MKQEIINCLTWYVNEIAETTAYKSWSDEYCRERVKKSTDKMLDKIKKYIDWDNLTEHECIELRFGKWTDKEGVDEEIKAAREYHEKNPEKCPDIEEKVAAIKRTEGLMLIPLWLLPLVPIGTELISISGDVIKYNGNNVDNDSRFGCVAYGIKPKEALCYLVEC